MPFTPQMFRAETQQTFPKPTHLTPSTIPIMLYFLNISIIMGLAIIMGYGQCTCLLCITAYSMDTIPEWQNVCDAVLSSRNHDVSWQRTSSRQLLPCQKKIAEEMSVSLGVISSLTTSTFCTLITKLFKELAFCSHYSNYMGILHLSFLHLIFFSHFLFNLYLQNALEFIIF